VLSSTRGKQKINPPADGFILHQLSRYLTEGDLELEMALNLDGGSSAGIVLRDPAESIPPFVALPAVIVVREK
jgi:hypothetical protein